MTKRADLDRNWSKAPILWDMIGCHKNHKIIDPKPNP